MEEEDDYENTKDDTKGSNDNELADSLEKDADVTDDDSKSSNPLDSDFAVFSQPTMADISEGLDIMKDNREFDDSGDEISEKKDTMDGNKGKTKESADNEKACDMEDKNTNRNTGDMERSMMKKNGKKTTKIVKTRVVIVKKRVVIITAGRTTQTIGPKILMC